MSSRRALLIAAADYQDSGLRKLRSPVHDVTELARLLRAPGIGGYEVQTLIDRPDVEVRGRLGRFLRTARRSDTLLIHFACHGFTDADGQLYLTAPDTELADISVTALSASLLSKLIDRSPSRRVILIIDCCFSGAISRVMTHRGDREVPVGEFFRGEGEGRAVITASKAEEYAWEVNHDPLAVLNNPLHSVFAEALIEGLRTGDADLDDDGEVSVDDLYRYVYQRVVSAGSAQTPSRWNFGQGTLYVAHRARDPLSSGTVEPQTHAVPDLTPWDADVLDWRYPLTVEFESFLTSRPLTVIERQAWRILHNGELVKADAAFGALTQKTAFDATAWWGLAYCAAAARRWSQAGAFFERAAGELPSEASVAATLLAASCWKAGGRPHTADVDEVAGHAPYAAELMAYRAVRTDRPTDLSRAFRLQPSLIGDFEAVGADIGLAVDRAVREADDLLALLTRAQAELSLARAGPLPADAPTPPVAGSVLPHGEARLLRCRELTISQRSLLSAALPSLIEKATRLLVTATTPADMAEVGALRDVTLTVLDVLRRTDQPTPMRLIGIPARRKRQIK